MEMELLDCHVLLPYHFLMADGVSVQIYCQFNSICARITGSHISAKKWKYKDRYNDDAMLVTGV